MTFILDVRTHAMLRMSDRLGSFERHRGAGGELSTFPMVNTVTTRARAPLRLGLAGGGTDLSPYCDEFGGAILNCTIDRFAYAFIEPRTDGQVCFRARDVGVEETHDVACLKNATLALHRGVYQRMAA